jgi:endoglucanase
MLLVISILISGIGLDVTIAYDTPGALPFEMITRLGKGTAIKILDGSIICDSRMIAFMKSTANKHAIPINWKY